MPKPTLDEALHSAISQATEGPSEPAQPVDAPDTTPGMEAAPEAPPEGQSDAQQTPDTSETTPATGPAREKNGQFAPKQAAPETTAQPAQPHSGGNAPRTWAPAVREQWATLPRPVKDQILKREGEISRALQESAESRKVAEGFERMLAPYRALLTGEPFQVVGNLLQTAAALQTAPKAHRAAIVAQIIQGYEVPLEAINEALSGKQPAAQPQQVPEYRDPRVDALLQQMQQREMQQYQTQVDSFATSAEFMDEVFDGRVRPDGQPSTVRDVMADLIESGVAQTLQEAYDKACLLSDNVRSVVEKRKAEEANRTKSQQAQQARYAAGSVQSQPAPPAGSRKPSLDEALMAALNGRR